MAKTTDKPTMTLGEFRKRHEALLTEFFGAGAKDSTPIPVEEADAAPLLQTQPGPTAEFLVPAIAPVQIAPTPLVPPVSIPPTASERSAFTDPGPVMPEKAVPGHPLFPLGTCGCITCLEAAQETK